MAAQRRSRTRREQVELTIDALAAGGDGIGRAPDGRVVFVPFTAPGDRVRAALVESRKRFARAEVEELLAPGPDRTDPACAVFGSCGGCAWQHVEYSAQVAAKGAILRDAFERLGRLRAPPTLVLHPSPEAYGYRQRARIRVERGRVGFRRRRSHRLCATRHCPVLTPPLQTALADFADAPPGAAAGDGDWELAAGSDGVTRASPLHREPGAPAGADGEATIELAVGEDRLRVSPGVFTQANGALLPALVDAVADAVGRGASALELYAGAGLLTLPLARRFDRVVAVESFAPAVADLRINLARAGLAYVAVEHADVAHYLEREAPRAELVLLDPPRTGLEPPVAAAIAGLGAARVVYLSCDPATLARDCAGFASAGYRLTRLEGFDLFPQTPHVEALAVLQRG